MGAHQFGNKPFIYGAVYFERYPLHIQTQGFNKSKCLTLHVTVNLCPGAPLKPILFLLDERLTINTVLVQMEDYHCHTKSTFHWHNLPPAVKRHCHITHQGGDLNLLPPRVMIFSLKLWGERPLAIFIFRTVLPLLNFNPVHYGIPLISICNAMVLISKRVGFAQNTHEPWEALVQNRVHQLIEETETGGSVFLQIMFIEVVYHMPHIMKPI